MEEKKKDKEHESISPGAYKVIYDPTYSTKRFIVEANPDEGFSEGFANFMNLYLDRILNFFEYDTEQYDNLCMSIRHIQIVRLQMIHDKGFFKMEENESDVVDSVLRDSEMIEKWKGKEEDWKVHYLRLVWNRLLFFLGMEFSEREIRVLKKRTFLDEDDWKDPRFPEFKKPKDRKDEFFK